MWPRMSAFFEALGSRDGDHPDRIPIEPGTGFPLCAGKQYGEDPPIEAVMRADAILEKGGPDGYGVWKRSWQHRQTCLLWNHRWISCP